MINKIIGKKLDQTQAFLEDGRRIPVTKIMVSDYPVISVKTQEKHGYSSIQIGFGKRKKPTKSILGQVRGAKLETAPQLFREVKMEDGQEMPQVGDVYKISEILKPGDLINASGISKGKGFAGGVKRYHFKGGPRTHGQSDRERAPGSIGQTTTPGRVYKGKRMAGKMGYENVTVKNLEVIEVSDDLLLVKGLIPGPRNSFVVIEKVGEDKKFVPLFKEETKEQEVVKVKEEEKVGETPKVEVKEEKEKVQIEPEDKKEEVK